MVSDQCPFFWTYDDARILENTRLHSLRAIFDFFLRWVRKETIIKRMDPKELSEFLNEESVLESEDDAGEEISGINSHALRP